MDLIKAAQVRANFKELSPENQEIVWAKTQAVRRHVEKKLAALPDLDRAAVCWLIAEILTELQGAPLGEASDMVYSSLIAYGIASVDFLGWFDQQPPQ